MYIKAKKSELLLEDTRNMLVNKSRGAGTYKDTSRGKNRFERKKYSSVGKTVKQYNKIDMNKMKTELILKDYDLKTHLLEKRFMRYNLL